VTLRDLTMRNAAVSKTDDGMAASVDVVGARFKLQDSTLIGGTWATIRLWPGADDAVIERSQISSAPVVCLETYEVQRVTVRDSRFHGCNPNRRADPGWHAGGAKIVLGSGHVITGNEFDHNQGPGVWFDGLVRNASITNNRVHHNSQNGIMVETADGVTVTGNRVWENGWNNTDGTGWGWAAGILSSSSRNVSITGNTVAWNPVGISFVDQNRPDRPGPAAGLVATGNKIAAESGRTTVGRYSDYAASTLTAGSIMSPNATATAADLTAAGIPTMPMAR